MLYVAPFFRILEISFFLLKKSDRRKSPDGAFPPKHPRCAHGSSAMPPNRTLVRLEVFFASAELRQKTDFKSPLRGQIKVFRQAVFFY